MPRELSIFADESGGRRGHSKCYLLTLVFRDRGNDILESVGMYENALRRADLPNIPFQSEPLLNGRSTYENLDISVRKKLLHSFAAIVRYFPISYRTLVYRRSEYEDLGAHEARHIGAALRQPGVPPVLRRGLLRQRPGHLEAGARCIIWQDQHAPLVPRFRKNVFTESMLRKRKCLDNGAVEQVFDDLGNEILRSRDRYDFKEFVADLETDIGHWSHARHQVKLKGLTPAEFRRQALREAAQRL